MQIATVNSPYHDDVTIIQLRFALVRHPMYCRGFSCCVPPNVTVGDFQSLLLPFNQTTRFTATHQQLLPYVSQPLKMRIYANHLITILQLSFSAAPDAEEAKCMATNPFTGQPKNSAARLRGAHCNSVGQGLAPHSTGKTQNYVPSI